MVNGIVNVYKEKGCTSFDVVAKMRGIFHQKKIGHTGTLDPDAEGVLPICLGRATRVCDLLTDKDKEYEAVLLLGQATDTQDISGQVLHTAQVLIEEQELREVIASFVGEQEQIPPMYSALKVGGQKLCDLARKGIEVERKPRKIHIFSIEILSVKLPEVTIRVHCSKGTYIRTLCNDIGEKAGCFGCMKSLIRTRAGEFRMEDAIKLGELEKLVRNTKEQAGAMDFVRGVDSVFRHYPEAFAGETAEKLLNNGNRIPKELVKNMSDGLKVPAVRMYNAQEMFVGIYSYQMETEDFKPVKIFMVSEDNR